MSEPYEETLQGEVTLRLPPGPRHELICSRLHDLVRASVADFPGTKLLAMRSEVQLDSHTKVRPDLALVAAATGKLWLAAEVVNSEDHKADTVFKKELYENSKLPRLWMVDPRYDNVEVYHASEYGMRLHEILAGQDVLSEKLLPEFQITVTDLFAAPSA
ncbi:MAG TPA: Uma2 family endonuclease [Verrucomicrobiae bacterium]|nr:Uma2 family endonuclease [Verrucomicrobiae bacterium]